MNTIIFTLATFFFFIMMLIMNYAERMVMTIPSLIFAGTCITLFILQFMNLEYLPAVAWAFGVMALCMTVFLLYTGGVDGLSYIWVFIIPNIAVMVVDSRGSRIYSGVLIALIFLLLHSPLYYYLRTEYSLSFRIMFPIAVLFVTLCVNLSEMVRSKTQKQLMESSKKLAEFAFTDPLTGAYNRHALLSHFGELDSSAHGLSFAMADLDFFKKVNDEYGHMVGDKMLCHVVERMQEGMPPGALLYRWGGEEFLLVLKTSDAEEVAALLESLCSDVGKTPLVTEDNNIPVTISIGGVCAGKRSTIKDCIEKADECLYDAKGSGRNKVVFCMA
ncbi:MAG: GGDEF domain-containing protein [Christensenellaceae bacterium]